MNKLKKLMAVGLAAVCAATVPASLAGCGGPEDDPHTLNIVALNAGYGKQWLQTIARRFEEEHSGYKVNLDNAIYQASSLINSHINSKNNVDDLYICVGTSWKAYAAQGKFASLDDLLEETVDGVAVKNKVAAEYSDSIYYPDKRGTLHTYRLPWTAGVGGIYYNKAMFEEYGWEVPSTYTELKTLCDTIADDPDAVVGSGNKEVHIKPFVYTGANIDYFDYVVYTWWAQMSGQQAIDEFMQYGSADNFDSDKNATYANLQTATTMWKDLFGNSRYVMSDCSSKTNHDAQTDFNNGYAAMMFNGDWIYNEILEYSINNSHFELALMPTPVVENAVDNSITYTIGEDQYIAIPSSSSKKSLAKDFIKLMISDYGCEVFLNQAHGILAYKTTRALQTEDTFMSNVLTVKNGYDHAFTNYPSFTESEKSGESKVNDNRKIYLSNLVDIWGTGGLRPYGNILTNGKSVSTSFSEIGNEIKRQWSGWRTDVGL